MKLRSTMMAVAAVSAFSSLPLQAATIFLDNTSGPGGLGELLDDLDSDDIGTPAATVDVPGFAGLSITFLDIFSSDAASGAFDLNSTATSLGINSATDTSTELFEAAFSQSATFSFNLDVAINSLDFTNFTAGEQFSFGGQLIGNDDLSNGTTDVFIFDTPLQIAANTSFTLETTTGSIGIEGLDITVIPEPSTSLFGVLGALALLRRRRQV